jgi:PAS domain S-box-containing protein
MEASGREQPSHEPRGAPSRVDLADPIWAGLLANVLDSAASGIAVLSGAELRFDLVNAAYRALTPRPDVDPVGIRYDEVWPDEAPVTLPTLRRVRDTGEPCHDEDHAFADRGRLRRLSFHVKAVPWRDGVGVLLVLWETTALWDAKRQAEDAAERAVRRASELEAMLEALPDGLILYGRRGEIVRTNDTAERLLALTPEEKARPLAGRSGCFRMFDANNRLLPLEETPSARALAGETVRSAHLRVEAAGRSGWILASAAPIRGPDGSPWGAVLTFSDESDLHHLEAARDDLVGMVSHDLRSPLNAILAQSHLLRADPREPTRVVERARAIAVSCDRMRSMIQDLLEATMLEAGQLRTRPAELDLAMFARDVVERHYGALAVDRVKVEAPASVPAHADPERLERILVNLVSNALKYSPPQGEVTVEVKGVEGGATVAVADRGVGIAPEDLPHVYEGFSRARGARRPEGLGLGLYITRLLVYAHGGRLDVESQLGRGSTFRVFLPDRCPLPTPPPGP